MNNICPLALSTAWNFNDNADPKKALSEIKALGFNSIEIGYNFTQEKLAAIIPLIEDAGMKVSSIHNFCPAPAEKIKGRHISDSFRISSPDEKERRKAVDYTKATVDTAYKVSCRVIVFHAGTIEMKDEKVRKIFHMYNEGKTGSLEYNTIKEKILKERETKKGPYMDAVVKSLREIARYADSSGVKIGLETRNYPHEIPDIEEIGYLLDLFGEKGLVYWHDIGHGEINERLGITPHEEFLRKFSSRLFGVHIHGLRGIDDHLAPFTGDFNLARISPYLRNDLIRVIEAHSQAKPEELVRARELLDSLPLFKAGHAYEKLI